MDSYINRRKNKIIVFNKEGEQSDLNYLPKGVKLKKTHKGINRQPNILPLTEDKIQNSFDLHKDLLLDIINGKKECSYKEAMEACENLAKLERILKHGEVFSAAFRYYLEDHYNNRKKEHHYPDLSDDYTM